MMTEKKMCTIEFQIDKIISDAMRTDNDSCMREFTSQKCVVPAVMLVFPDADSFSIAGMSKTEENFKATFDRSVVPTLKRCLSITCTHSKYCLKTEPIGPQCPSERKKIQMSSSSFASSEAIAANTRR